MDRQASNAIPVTWNNETFGSFGKLDDHLGKTRSYSRSYWEQNIPLLGHKVKRVDGKVTNIKHKRIKISVWTDDDLKAWHGFIMIRKGMVQEFGIDEMIDRFRKFINKN